MRTELFRSEELESAKRVPAIVLHADQAAQNSGGVAMNPTTTTIRWQKDADQALEEAKGAGKPILIDFTAAPT